jgi:hypothetical protein
MTPPPLLTRLGWSRPPTPVHGHDVVTVELQGMGSLRLARWLHPLARRAPVSLEATRVTAMQAHLRAGDTAVVIGAGQGAEALELGLAVGPSGAVVALEADRSVFPVLAANGALNRDRLRLLPHLVAVAGTDALPPPFGVASQPLEPFLRARHAGLVDRLRWISLPFGAGGPSLVAALGPLLVAFRPVVRCRVDRTARRPQRQALLSCFGELGYRVDRFAWDGAVPAEPLGAANLMRWKQLDVLAVP